ncbi:MAG: putative Ig domain-containing protein, partial [Lysobacterales bacterium]
STIKTPSAIIGIRGSELDGDVAEDGTTLIRHTDGFLTITDINEQNPVVLQIPGNTSVSLLDGAPVFSSQPSVQQAQTIDTGLLPPPGSNIDPRASEPDEPGIDDEPTVDETQTETGEVSGEEETAADAEADATDETEADETGEEVEDTADESAESVDEGDAGDDAEPDRESEEIAADADAAGEGADAGDTEAADGAVRTDADAATADSADTAEGGVSDDTAAASVDGADVPAGDDEIAGDGDAGQTRTDGTADTGDGGADIAVGDGVADAGTDTTQVQTETDTLASQPDRFAITDVNPADYTVIDLAEGDTSGSFDQATPETGEIVLTREVTTETQELLIGNNPPEPVPLSDQIAIEGIPFGLPVTSSSFFDPDGDRLTLTATGLPPGLSFDASTETILGTPGPGSAGDHIITVSARDPHQALATNNFTLTVIGLGGAGSGNIPP